MKHRYSFSALLLVSIATPAQAQFTYTPPACAPGSFGCGRREATTTLTDACPTDRWIGYWLGSLPAQCPAAGASIRGTWIRGSLFPPISAPMMPIPDALARFCVYQWQPATGTSNAPHVATLPDIANLRLERDCRVVAPLYTPKSATADVLRSAFDEQVVRPHFSVGALVPNRVRVAVIDSALDETVSGLPSGGLGSHGRAVATLIHDLSCMKTTGLDILGCTAFITSHQGLNLGLQDGDGSYGTTAGVAQAMMRAIQSFTQQAIQTRMIINLSLGWDGQYGGYHGPTMRISALAPFLVTQWADYLGILVISAAGNASKLDGQSGAMFPAGWEAEPLTLYPIGGPYWPVVFAVGGVDGADVPLVTTRANSLPRMVAPSAWVVSKRRDGPTGLEIGATALLSGTSMSAAAVSGVAAMVWAFQPAQLRQDVMDVIYQNGTTLPGEAAALVRSPSVWEQHRLDACNAAGAVATPARHLEVCGEHPAGLDLTADFAAVFSMEWPGLETGGATPGSVVIEPGSPIPPSTEELVVKPWVVPQPGSNTCVGCKMVNNAVLGKLDMAKDAVIDKIILSLNECDGPPCKADIGGIELSISKPKEPFNLAVPGLNPAHYESASMSISFHQNGESVVTLSPILLAP